MNLDPSLAQRIPTIEKIIAAEFEKFYRDCPSENLRDAIHYALSSGGKRIRPLLTWLCYDACLGHSREGRNLSDSWGPHSWINPALAVEWIHTYSLIHDDLPAMDDDDERRGKPSLHRKFDEATAILAGDALLSDAFALLSKSAIHAAEMCKELSIAIGSNGMVAGQDLDLRRECHSGFALSRPGVNPLLEINTLKTGKLFEASCVLGGLAAKAKSDRLSQLREIGCLFGLLFQHRDDQLDGETGPAINLPDIQQSLNSTLDALPGNTQDLRALIQFCIHRPS